MRSLRRVEAMRILTELLQTENTLSLKSDTEHDLSALAHSIERRKHLTASEIARYTLLLTIRQTIALERIADALGKEEVETRSL